MRGDDQIPATSEMSIGSDAERIARKLIGAGVFINLPALGANRGDQSREVLSRVNACLMLEANARPTHERDLLDERGIEVQIARQGRLIRECAASFWRRLTPWHVQVAIDPFE